MSLTVADSRRERPATMPAAERGGAGAPRRVAFWLLALVFAATMLGTGDLTGRGSPVLRGAITGGGTFAGGIFHTLPFLIPGYAAAVGAAIAVVAAELLVLAWLRHKFFQTSFARSFLAITVGGAIIAALSAALGAAAGS